MGLITFIAVAFPEAFKDDEFLVFVVIIISFFVIGIFSFLYLTFASAYTNVSIKEEGLHFEFLKKRKSFQKDRFLPFSEIQNFSFGIINGQYIEITTRKNKETIRLLKSSTIFSKTTPERDEKYEAFCSELKKTIDRYNQQEHFNKIRNESFWKTKKGRAVGYIILVIDLAILIVFLSGVFFEFSFSTIKAVFVIILSIPLLLAIFKKQN